MRPDFVAPGERPSAPATSPAKTPKTKSPKAGRVKHVFVITLDSPGFDNSFGAQSQMPYLANTLRPQGELLSNYSLLTDTGLPNYIAMVGGQAPNPLTSWRLHDLRGIPRERPAGPQRERGRQRLRLSGPDDQPRGPALRCALQLGRVHGGHGQGGAGHPGGDRSGEPAADLCPPGLRRCRPDPDVRKADPSTGYAGSGYAARHNPFVYFHSLLDLGSCTQRDVPLDRLDGALASGTPNFSFISPNLCDTGEPTECDADIKDPGPSQADKFLADWVPKILASPAYKQDGVLIITFGEATPGVNGAPVGTLLISKFLTPGSTSGAAFNPYSIFRTVEDLFGLQHITAGARTGTTTFAPNLLGSQKKKK